MLIFLVSQSPGERAFVGIISTLLALLFFYLCRKISEKRADYKDRKTMNKEKINSFIYGHKESYYRLLVPELLVLCAPKQFMNNYDPLKVKTANELFARLVDGTQKDNLTSQEIIKIRNSAETCLGVKLSTDSVFKLLETACSPNRFMEPYNPAALDRANVLYNEILLNKNCLSELERIGDIAREEGFLDLFKSTREDIVL